MNDLKPYLKPLNERLGPAGLRALEEYTQVQIEQHLAEIQRLRSALEKEQSL